jgi:UbiA prenyltransferase family
MKLGTALRLGRVSNLPTTWTNVAAGLALSGAALQPAAFALLGFAVSCFYVGGMYLNDAFDREYDARERPERPIPSGQVSARTVFAIGFGLLAAGVATVAAIALQPGGTGLPPVLAAIGLCALIVVYDLHHKANPWSPLLMAGNRLLVYVTAALCARVAFPLALGWGGLSLLGYLIGLTYIAKQENLQRLPNLWPLAFLAVPFAYVPGLLTPSGQLLAALLALSTALSLRDLFGPQRNVKRAVSRLIAGISLVDGLMIAGTAAPQLALLCVLGYAATLVLQRFVPGT